MGQLVTERVVIQTTKTYADKKPKILSKTIIHHASSNKEVYKFLASIEKTFQEHDYITRHVDNGLIGFNRSTKTHVNIRFYKVNFLIF